MCWTHHGGGGPEVLNGPRRRYSSPSFSQRCVGLRLPERAQAASSAARPALRCARGCFHPDMRKQQALQPAPYTAGRAQTHQAWCKYSRQGQFQTQQAGPVPNTAGRAQTNQAWCKYSRQGRFQTQQAGQSQAAGLPQAPQ